MSTETTTADRVRTPTQGLDFGRVLRDYAIVWIVLVLFVVLSLTADSFFSFTNIMNIIDQNTPLMLIAIGTTLVIISGGFDLSAGQVMSVAGVVSAEVVFQTANPVLGVLAGIAVGLPLGMVNGLLVAGLKINSFLATLATGLVFGGLALAITDGLSRDLSSNTTFQWLGSNRVGSVPNPVIISVIVFAVLWFVLARTKFGHYLFAIGSNQEAARLSGLPILRVKVAAYALAGICAALAGVITTTRTGVGTIVPGADKYTLDAIAAVVVGGTSILGGRGAMWRTALGVLLIALVRNAMNLMSIEPFWQQIVSGLIIIVAIVANAAAGRRS
jgi:ribose transport system permease protein